MNKYYDRIEALRSLMLAHGWDAVIVAGSDPHQSEYPAPRWKQVEWLTGFTGEAGDVVVTADHAGLWTDSRYFIQAVQQLEGTGVQLHKTRVPEQVLIPEWLEQTLGPDAVVAVDSLCQSASAVDELKSLFSVALVADMLSCLWEDRPQIPQTPVLLAQTGESLDSKIEWLREEIERAGAQAALVTSLDDVAWLLNVRASDIEYNPLVISHLLVSKDEAKWFVLKEDVEDPDTDASFAQLADHGVQICSYFEVGQSLSYLDGALMVDPSTLNAELRSQIGCEVRGWDSPVQLRKAVKNDYEIDCMRDVHVDDGVAMEKFLFWLERSLDAGKRITEWDASVKLSQYRSEIDDYMGDSFETISAFGPGAALPHYVTPQSGAPVIEQRGLYLVDSGGQYLRGTTDITRTVPVGDCTPEEVRDYSLVLKGHIALAMAKFPAGTPGCRLDVLAREPLWEAGLDYGHGTGHGIGFYLGVHEGPQQIRQNLNPVPMMEGMITSNEPGLYVEGSHGVRHENLVLCVPAGATPFGSFLAFETLTLCHFDTSILDWSLLSSREAEWLKAYNRRVYAVLESRLPDDVREWLRIKTES